MAAWLARRELTVDFAGNEEWAPISAETDGEGVYQLGHCLLCRASDNKTALLGGKPFPLSKAIALPVFALAEQIANRAIESKIVRARDGWGKASPADMRRWHEAQIKIDRKGPGEFFLDLARSLVSAWKDGKEWRYGDGFVSAATLKGAIYLDHECLLTRPPDYRIALVSGVRYPQGSSRLVLRESLRLSLDEFEIPQRAIKPLERKRLTDAASLIRAWEASSPRVQTRVDTYDWDATDE